MKQIPKIKLGNTGQIVSRLGFGGGWIIEGEGVSEKQAIKIIQKAVGLGIDYFDTASSYGKGDSERRIGKAIEFFRDKIFLATKVLSRTKDEVENELEGSFSRLNTDVIDLVQIHGIKTEEDLEVIFHSNGSLKVVEEFKRKRKIKFIGITGHHNPEVLIEALKRFEFDTVMFPVNPGEEYFGHFKELAKKCREKKIGSIGMKVIGEGKFVDPLEDYLSYALEYVDVVLVGIKTMGELGKVTEAVKNIRKFLEQEKRNLKSKAEEIIKSSKKPEIFWWRR